MTDKLTLTPALEGGGMESEAAERIATEIYDAIHNNVATKADILAVRGDIVRLRTEIKDDGLPPSAARCTRWRTASAFGLAR